MLGDASRREACLLPVCLLPVCTLREDEVHFQNGAIDVQSHRLWTSLRVTRVTWSWGMHVKLETGSRELCMCPMCGELGISILILFLKAVCAPT